MNTAPSDTVTALTDALVAGALSAYSPQQAQDYFDNSVGHETGQFIGGLLTNPVSKLFSFTSSPARQPNAGAGSSASTTSQQSGPATLSAATTAGPQSTGQGNGITADQADGILVDANGNPIAIEPSLEQIQLNPQLVQLPAISVTAQPGDSISTLLGTSDPVAIEAFMRANGLSDSTIIAGELYAAKRE